MLTLSSLIFVIFTSKYLLFPRKGKNMYMYKLLGSFRHPMLNARCLVYLLVTATVWPGWDFILPSVDPSAFLFFKILLDWLPDWVDCMRFKSIQLSVMKARWGLLVPKCWKLWISHIYKLYLFMWKFYSTKRSGLIGLLYHVFLSFVGFTFILHMWLIKFDKKINCRKAYLFKN